MPPCFLVDNAKLGGVFFFIVLDFIIIIMRKRAQYSYRMVYTSYSQMMLNNLNFNQIDHGVPNSRET